MAGVNSRFAALTGEEIQQMCTFLESVSCVLTEFVFTNTIILFNRDEQKLLEHSWQVFARFLYGASVHLNLNRRTPCVHQIA